MRLLHFGALKPICPACRLNGRESRLALDAGARAINGDVWSGILRCTAVECARTYPIIDGAPILVPDVASWLSANLHLVLQGELDTPELEGLVGAAVGPDAAFNVVRQQQASYAHDHYRDVFDEPNARADGEGAGSIRRCLAVVQDHLPPACGPVLDIGCATGRTTLDLASSNTCTVLGIDLNWPLLKIARGVIDRGVASYPHRRAGMRYERRTAPVMFPGQERADFWVADALALPFSPATFGQIIALNVIDCVVDPLALFREAGRALGGQGQFALATPYDWGSHATPPSAWLDSGDALLWAADQSGKTLSGMHLKPFGPRLDLDWEVRLHDRAKVKYQSELLMFSKDDVM